MTMVDATKVTFTGEIHPAAEAWPLLPEDELAELAASIAEIGLQDPITLDPAGRLLDGRNRLNACREVDVEPEFVVYDGDPVPFILAKNADRRHMGTGERAMATAVVLTEAGYRKNGRWAYGALSQTDGSVGSESWRARMRQAGVVIDHAPNLAAKVISGAVALDAAHQQAKRLKDASESFDIRLSDLKAKAPDLAERVADEHTLVEQEAAYRERCTEWEKQFRMHVKWVQGCVNNWATLRSLAAGTFPEQEDVLAELNPQDRELIDEAVRVIRKGMKR